MDNKKEDVIRLQIEHVIEEIWSMMCRTTDDVRLLTDKYGMQALDGLKNPTIDDMLSLTQRLVGICDDVIEKIGLLDGYIDVRLLLNAKQMYIHFQQMVVAYKAENISDFLSARDELKRQAHF